MGQRLLSRYSAVRLSTEKFREQRHCLWVDCVVLRLAQIEPHHTVTFIDFLELATCKEGSSSEEHVEDSTGREHVACWLETLPLSKSSNFRGHISWSATPVEKIIRTVTVSREPKVSDDWFER